MNTAMATWSKKSAVGLFYLLAFAITWLGWLPQTAYARGSFPFDSPAFYILGGVGPLLAVFLTHKVTSGSADFGAIFRPFLQWRAGWWWYLAALLGYPLIWLLALALNGELPGALAQWKPAGMPLTFFVAFLAAIPESVAWRGFALPRLQANHNALVASLIVGVLWALWHLPLLFNPDNVMSTYPLAVFVLTVSARSVIYTWLYNNTGGSLLFITLFHAVSNTLGTFEGVSELAVSTVIAVVLVWVFGAEHLSRRGSRITASQ